MDPTQTPTATPSATIAPTATLTSTIAPTASPTPYINPTSGISLSELMANPDTGNEWVEIYNNNDFAVSLNNWKVTDSGPNTIDFNIGIAAKGYDYLTIYSVFNNDGDSVRLLDQNGSQIDSYSYTTAQKGYSFSRQSGGSWCSALPTQNRANNSCYSPTSTPTTTPTATRTPSPTTVSFTTAPTASSTPRATSTPIPPLSPVPTFIVPTDLPSTPFPTDDLSLPPPSPPEDILGLSDIVIATPTPLPLISSSRFSSSILSALLIGAGLLFLLVPLVITKFSRR